jgi:hypothetical protein
VGKKNEDGRKESSVKTIASRCSTKETSTVVDLLNL